MDVMFDLETMGTRPGAPIIAIGAVAFTEEKVITDRTFYVNVSLSSCARFGLGGIDASTVEWWMTQSNEARAALFEPEPVELDKALADFVAFTVDPMKPGKVRLWANGIHFDYGILLAAYDVAGIAMAWDHRAPRDLRTLRDIAERLGIPYARPEPTMPHQALSDAIAAATEAVILTRELKRKFGGDVPRVAEVRARLDATINHRDAGVRTDSAYLYGELVCARDALSKVLP